MTTQKIAVLCGFAGLVLTAGAACSSDDADVTGDGGRSGSSGSNAGGAAGNSGAAGAGGGGSSGAAGAGGGGSSGASGAAGGGSSGAAGTGGGGSGAAGGGGGSSGAAGAGGGGGSGAAGAGGGGSGTAGSSGAAGQASTPRLVTLSRTGKVASLDLASPWTVRASKDLGSDIGSARCRGGRCAVVHPAANSVDIVRASDLSVAWTFSLAGKASPRDVALVDDHTAVVSQWDSHELLELDLDAHTSTPIDLGVFADDDGVPEASRLASCGRRVFVQLLRLDHATELPSSKPALVGVVDLDRPAGERVVDVDPATSGVQGVVLARRPAFDMPVDCAAGVLYVGEPIPLMKGGGGYETVNLSTYVASEFPIATGAEVGGFEIVTPAKYWLITHTEFGPGPSSHLTFSAGGTTHNTFANEHVNELALALPEDMLFFPDPCTKIVFGACEPGVHVFQASTGAPLTTIDVGFQPVEVTISR